jgi:hypothetical protein
MRTARRLFLILGIGAFAMTIARTQLVISRAWGRSPDTADHRPWVPSSAVQHPANYAGTQVCAECHAPEFEEHNKNPMSHSAMRPPDSPFLRQPGISFTQGAYTYSISHEGEKLFLTVSDSQGKITTPIVLVFGAGVVHQLFLLQHDNHYHLSRVSFYTTTGKLEQWANAPPEPPTSLEAALGQNYPDEKIRNCFHCHNALGVVGNGFDMTRAFPGTPCETCHGPGAKHVAAILAGSFQDTLIFNPQRLSASEELDFCGACHSSPKQHGTTAQSVKNGDLRGVRTVLSQPYRFMSSRCWNSADARSRCTFCHDPHQAVAHEAAAYDAKCLACHASEASATAHAAQLGKACPVGKHNCTSCHMPPVEVPGTRLTFTDHRIRVSRPGEPYPD